jgi:hypothetical protein
MLREDESRIIAKLAECFEEFKALPDPHPMDHEEFASGIHVLQRHVMARSTRRDNPELFPSWNSSSTPSSANKESP